MSQSTTESFRIEKDILDSVKKIISKTGQTSKSYIEMVLKKQIEKIISEELNTIIQELYRISLPNVFISRILFNSIVLSNIL